jgi:hypothetical protein
MRVEASYDSASRGRREAATEEGYGARAARVRSTCQRQPIPPVPPVFRRVFEWRGPRLQISSLWGLARMLETKEVWRRFDRAALAPERQITKSPILFSLNEAWVRIRQKRPGVNRRAYCRPESWRASASHLNWMPGPPERACRERCGPIFHRPTLRGYLVVLAERWWPDRSLSKSP